MINNQLPHNYQGIPFRGKVSYGYDALGRKIEKKVNKINQPKQDVSYYIYDGQGINILAEYEVRGFKPGQGPKHNPSKGIGKYQNYSEYYYGNDSLVAMKHSKRPLMWKNNGNGKGSVKTSFYHQDALGSVSMLTGKNGQVRERYEYDAYGIPYNGKFQKGNNMNPYGFTGKRYEVEVGIYSFAYRHYDPRTMRWLTVDQVKDGNHWYLYVNADPVNFVDPLGLCDIERSEKFDENGYTFTKNIYNQTSYFGAYKYDIDTSVSLNTNVDSKWRVDNTGTISYQDDAINMGVNDGQLTVGNTTYSGNYNTGGKYVNVGNMMESQSGGELNVSVSNQNVLLGKPEPDGYVPISKQKVEISDNKGALKITNETIVKVKKELRDTAYYGTVVTGGVVVVGGVTLLLNKGFYPLPATQ